MRIVAPLLLTGAAFAKRRKKVVDPEAGEKYNTYVGGEYGLKGTGANFFSTVEDFERLTVQPEERSETPYPLTYKDSCGSMSAGSMINRIAGGWDIPIEEHPWMAFLQLCSRSNKACGMCGGSVISPLWILTAAHCTLGAEITVAASQTMVSVGIADLSAKTAANLRNVIKIVTYPYYLGPIRKNGRDPNCGKNYPSWHPKFNIKCQGVDTHEQMHHIIRNDMGLVKVDINMFGAGSSLTTDEVFPICLPASDFCLEPYTTVMATGWGRLGTGNPADISATLRGVYLPVIQLAKCRLYVDHRQRFPLKKWYGLNQNMTCASALLKSASCIGDTGGPLFYRDKNHVTTVYGSTSWGLGCGRGGSPGVYARVSSFLEWIQETSGVFMTNDADNSYTDVCRDYISNTAFTAPLDALTSQVVTGQNLIKSHHTFDNFCIRIQHGQLANTDASYQLQLRDPNGCNPAWDETQWVKNGELIQSVANSGYCWGADSATGPKAYVYVVPCDGSTSQRWTWTSSTGMLTNVAFNGYFRVRPNKRAQVIDAAYVPESVQFAKPDANGVIKPVTFLTNFCASKGGSTKKWKVNDYIYTRKAGCAAGGGTAKWYWDASTKQIKNITPGRQNKKWCWSANPKSKRRNYVRLVRCRKPLVTMQDDGLYVARSQANTVFDWTVEGFLYPARNDRLMLRFSRHKRVEIVDKWLSGWSYRVGEVIA